MADFYATSRSNYVLVKDVDAAIEALKDFDIPVRRHPKNANAIMLTGCDGDGTFSIVSYEELVETYLDLQEWCKKHLVEGQVLILVSAGAEKLRYVTAWAEAYTWKGEQVSVDLLGTLFSRLQSELGIDPKSVADPSYTNLAGDLT